MEVSLPESPSTTLFAQPWAFLILLLIPLFIGLYLWNQRASKRSLKGFITERLRSELFHGYRPGLRLLKFILTSLGCLFLVFALARPQHGFIEKPATRKGLDLVICLDTSRSMLAQDITPFRLKRAKLAIQDLIKELEGDRIGLVVFAGDAFLQCPLTTDYNAFRRDLEIADTEVITTGGTNIARAMVIASDALSKSEGDHRAIILVTDGEELDEDGIAMARRVKDQGIRVFALGMGTAAGTAITVPGPGGRSYIRDSDNKVVVSKLDEGRLKEIAAEGGGFYERFVDLETVRSLKQNGLDNLEKRDIDIRTERKPIEYYQYPLALSLFFLLLGFGIRRN